jgi:hypothetical protein
MTRLADDLLTLETGTFEIQDVVSTGTDLANEPAMDDPGASSSTSTSCSSCCSSSTSGTASCCSTSSMSSSSGSS